VLRAEIKGKPLHLDYDSMVAANEVFKDRETGSRWQQGTATAISGPLKGTQLPIYPFLRTTWGEWKKQHPETLVLRPLPGYAENMTGMNKLISRAKLGEGAAPKARLSHDDRLRPRQTIAGLEIGHLAQAYPLSTLREAHVVNDKVGGIPVLIVHQPESDTTTAFERRLKSKTLEFQAVDQEASELIDVQTKSTWNAYGACLSGPLKGSHLKPLILVPEFWFAWSEFHPNTNVYNPGGAP
jgi:hypothetical protein